MAYIKDQQQAHLEKCRELVLSVSVPNCKGLFEASVDYNKEKYDLFICALIETAFG